MFPHFGGGGASLPEIGHSLRVNQADSAYLTRTQGASGSTKKGTFSFWVKRTKLGYADDVVYDTSGTSDTARFIAAFTSADKLRVMGNTTVWRLSTQVFRDVSSWYHIVIACDTDQATANDRIKIYVNGAQLTAFDTTNNPGSGAQLGFSYNGSIWLARYAGAGSYSNCYFARSCFVDGAQSAPGDFAYTDSNGQWRTKTASAVKSVVDAGGTNSFMLDFDDGTSTTTLGNDYSAKNNDWTLTNFTRSAGANDDWMEDTPTNNFCVLSTLDNTTGTLSDGGLQYDQTAAGDAIRGSVSVTSGKWYFEGTYTASGSVDGSAVIGVALADSDRDSSTSIVTVADGTYVYRDDGLTITAGASTAGFTNYGGGAVIMVALDLDNGKLWWGYNGTWEKSGAVGDPTAGTNQHYSLSAYSGRPFTPHIGFQSATGTESWDMNFGQRAFAYTPPTGFKALCTKNLPAPSIVKPAQHHDIKLYTGNASTQAITGLLFPPGLVNLKSRGRAVDWAWYDQVRGVEKRLETNNTDAEVTGDTTGLTAFNSDGWTMGALDQINGTTATNSFVGFAWKANGAGVSNTDGSITSTVSANQIAGFSIVTYTGTGANATVGHGLGVAPKLVIVKQRSSGTTENWATWHTSIANTEYLLLNGTAAKAAGATYWNSASPTASVFSVGASNDTNENTKEYVAYCFAEISGYSKFGSYTGNGSTDGPFMWCGFRPKYVLVKRTDSTGSWELYDAARGSKNPMGTTDLQADTAGAENASTISTGLDFLSNGFKGRDTTSYLNASSGTYIFAAFAEAPFKFANAR